MCHGVLMELRRHLPTWSRQGFLDSVVWRVLRQVDSEVPPNSPAPASHLHVSARIIGAHYGTRLLV